MNIELELNKPQLGALLHCIEVICAADFNPQIARGPDLMNQARAAGPCEESYTIDLLAPTYERLVAHWTGKKHFAGSCAMSGEAERRYGERMVEKRAIDAVLAKASAP